MGPSLLCFGLPRSGTQCETTSPIALCQLTLSVAIADALLTLGMKKVYHMREVGKNNHQEIWTTLVQLKLSGGDTAAIKSGIDSILSDYDVSSKVQLQTFTRLLSQRSQAVLDFPATLFVCELVDLYPHAKKILVKRDKEAWEKSMAATLVHAHTAPTDGRAPSRMRPLADAYHKYCWGDDFDRNGGNYYDEYMKLVEDAAGDQELLTYRVQYGWQPLCELLRLPIPQDEFPSVDAWRAYKLQHGIL